MIAPETIPLFNSCRLDVRQARGVIMALSGAEVIREWELLAASTPRAVVSPRCYASITQGEPGARDGHRLLIGRGTTPARAIEDLLWQVVTPHLLSE